MADHYRHWRATASKPGINFLDVENFTPADVSNLRRRIAELEEQHGNSLGVVVISIHWGPNYSWDPHPAFVRFAHAIIDACSDGLARHQRPSLLIHGHSAHHVQGMERYRGGVVLYGCGDFVDDYVVDHHFRNDLAFLFRLRWDAAGRRWRDVELHPTKIANFAVGLQMPPQDRRWLLQTARRLSSPFRTRYPGGRGGGRRGEGAAGGGDKEGVGVMKKWWMPCCCCFQVVVVVNT